MALQAHIVSELGDGDPWRAIIVGLVQKPDPGSTFATATSDVRHLPANELLQTLFARGYEGLLFSQAEQLGKRGELIGGIFWQEHRANGTYTWKVFRLIVDENFRQQGYGCQQVEIFLRHAHDRHVHNIYLGAGGSEIIKRIFQKIKSGEIALPFSLQCEERDYSITL